MRHHRLVSVWEAEGGLSGSTDALGIFVCPSECIEAASLSPNESGRILLLPTSSGITDTGDKTLMIKTEGYLKSKGNLTLAILN